jgi:pimeloyl-ACP methyl ester carboxylesterase
LVVVAAVLVPCAGPRLAAGRDGTPPAGKTRPAVGLFADEEESKPAAAAKAPAANESIKEKDLPVALGGGDLVTKDGVQLRATFFPGLKGKESVPVILLHSFKGNRNEYSVLAPFLQSKGHAVLVPDLRGHGESVNTMDGEKLEAGRPVPAQFEQMVYKDMETLRQFLIRKNNAGELNISKLCVVGTELGALVAINWAYYDWYSLTGERPPMYVKALVLISPPRNLKGFSAQKALAYEPLRKELAVMILAGEEKGKEYRDAEAFYKQFKRFHPDPPEDEQVAKQDLFFRPLATKLQGKELLGEKGLHVEEMIAYFIDLRLVRHDQPEYLWRERSVTGR